MNNIYGIKYKEATNTYYVKEFSLSNVVEALKECICVSFTLDDAFTTGNVFNSKTGNKTYLKYIGMVE